MTPSREGTRSRDGRNRPARGERPGNPVREPGGAARKPGRPAGAALRAGRSRRGASARPGRLVSLAFVRPGGRRAEFFPGKAPGRVQPRPGLVPGRVLRDREQEWATSPRSSRRTTSAASYPTSSTTSIAEAVGRRVRPGHRAPSRSSTAHDMRESSVPLAAAFAGAPPPRAPTSIEAGLGSTDLLYYASGTLDLPGAMFTASHNPARYNGIKLCRAGRRARRPGQRPRRDPRPMAEDGRPRPRRRAAARSPSATCSPATPPT